MHILHLKKDTALAPRMDPTHPTLRGFNLEYQWDSVQEEDFAFGVRVLFMSAIIGFIVILSMICSHISIFDRNDPRSKKNSSGRATKR
jgi:hypothetical protein